MSPRIGVTGGRNYGTIPDDAHGGLAAPRWRQQRATVWVGLSMVAASIGQFTLVHGDCATGADLAAEMWYVHLAKGYLQVDRVAYPARWRQFGKGAGPMRNQKMVDDGLQALLAFPGGAGTADMVRRARYAHIPVLEISDDGGAMGQRLELLRNMLGLGHIAA